MEIVYNILIWISTELNFVGIFDARANVISYAQFGRVLDDSSSRTDNSDNSDAVGSRIQQKCENWDRWKSRIDEGVILRSCASNGIYDTRTVPRSHGVWFHVAGNHQSAPTSFWFLISISHRIWVNRQIAAHAIPMDVHVDSVFRRSSSALIKSIVKFVLDRLENQ